MWSDRLQARCRETGEQRDHVGLSIAAGLFQNSAHMGSNCIFGRAGARGDLRNRLPLGQIAGHSRLGRREVEQRFHDRQRRSVWGRQGSERQNAGAANEDVSSGQADRHDMRDHCGGPIGAANREGPRGRAFWGADGLNGRAQQRSAFRSLSERRSRASHRISLVIASINGLAAMTLPLSSKTRAARPSASRTWVVARARSSCRRADMVAARARCGPIVSSMAIACGSTGPRS
jgi:hypothetical protein